MSTMEPFRGIRSIILPTCTSKLDSSDTWALANKGFKSCRERFHAWPSTVIIPEPRKGEHILWFMGALPNLETCVARTVCMLEESIVTYCLVPQLLVRTVFPYAFKRSLSIARESPELMSRMRFMKRSRPRMGSRWGNSMGEEHPALRAARR